MKSFTLLSCYVKVANVCCRAMNDTQLLLVNVSYRDAYSTGLRHCEAGYYFFFFVVDLVVFP